MEAISKIYSRYPIIKKKIENLNDPSISFTTQEAVFFQLVRFFENPQLHQFSLNMIYEHLKDDDLLFSIEMIILYFQKDTSLVQDVSQSFYNESLLSQQIVGQKGFSDMVEKVIKGGKYPPSWINVYWKRGSDRIPRPSLIISGTPYWTVEDVESFIKKEKALQKEKKRKK